MKLLTLTEYQFASLVHDVTTFVPDTVYSWSELYLHYIEDANEILDRDYDIHIFLYFDKYLVLFGNRLKETLFRLKYSDIIYA